MLFNSINYALKDVFYNLEKVLSGKKTAPLERSEQTRLNVSQNKNIEASTVSGQFLERARRGEILKPDSEETYEIVKDFVRTKPAPHFEDPAVDEDIDSVKALTTLTRSITDETPVFGLKSSLRAHTDTGSFDAWKSAHHLMNDDEKTWKKPRTELEEVTSGTAIAGRSWRDLSRRTALRLIDHPNTPAEVLFELANHFDIEVRSQVADNLNAPEQAILKLIKDESIDVRFALAENHHLGKANLTLLLEDENPYVAERAKVTLHRIFAEENPTPVSVIGNMFGMSNRKEQSATPLRAHVG